MIKIIQKIIFIGSSLLPHSGRSMDTGSVTNSSSYSISDPTSKSSSYEMSTTTNATSESSSYEGNIDTDSASEASSSESSSSSVYLPKTLAKEIIERSINEPVLMNFEPLMKEAISGLKKAHCFSRLNEEGLWKNIWSYLDDNSKLRISLFTRASYKIIGQNMLLYFGELKINAVLGRKNPTADFDIFFGASQYIESLTQENPSRDNPFKKDFQEIKKVKTKLSQDNLFSGYYLPGLKARAFSILKANESEAGEYLKSAKFLVQNSDITTKYHKLGAIYNCPTKDLLKVSGSVNQDSDKPCIYSCDKACTSHNIKKCCYITLCCPVAIAISPCFCLWILFEDC